MEHNSGHTSSIPSSGVTRSTVAGPVKTSSSRLVSLHSSVSAVTAPAINAVSINTAPDTPTGSQSPISDDNVLADDTQENEKALNPRKRRRIPVSCAVCRQRKLKCNRMQPCSACIAHETVPLCVYAVKPWLPGSQVPGLTIPGTQTFNILTPVSGHGQPTPQNQVPGFHGEAPVAIISSQDAVSDPNTSLNRQIQTSSQIPLDPAVATEYNELKMRMARLENLIQGMANPASPPPTIGALSSRPTLLSAATPARMPPETTATANPDSALSTYTSSLKPQIQIKKNRVAFLGPLSSLAVVTQDEFIQSLVGKGKKGVLTWKKMHKSHVEQSNRRGDKTKIPKPASEHSSRVKPGPELQAVLQNLFDVNQNASQMFPRLVHRPICEFLITKYMQTINMVFPIVHPTVFREDMEKFWTKKAKAANNLNGTSAARKQNMRGTALFAILLRLGRLALPVDWTPSQEGFDDSLAAFFGRDLKEFAWSCLRSTNYTGKADFVVVQVLLGLRLELLLAPQGGDGPDLADSAGYIGIVCQIGLTMGLHRDPTSFPRVPPDMADAWRLLWLEMLEIDTDRALCINLPFALPLEMSDTQLDKIIGFPNAVAVNEQPSVNFLQAKTKLVLLTRFILTRIMRPNFVISKDEFHQYSEELTKFDERNLGSFQLLLEMIRADTDAAVQGPSDSYDLIQKYFLQLQFLRLQLVLLTAYSPRDAVEEEELRVQRIRCALKMLDTISTCMLRPRLFAGFMWLVVPIALRHHNFSLSLIARQLLKDLAEQPLMVEQERSQLVEDRWMIPDMAFKYNSNNIKDFKRLYQAFMNTSTWVHSFADTYYYAYNSGLVLRVFSDSFKIHIISDHEKGSSRLEPNLVSDGGSTLEVLNDTPDSQQLDGMPDWSSMLGNFVLDDSIGDWWHDWSMSGDSGLHEQLESASGQAWNADH
ncbi:uncharacterized protein V1513DRAFT_380083 [Lipomyces chichibuensis]|uniref:uncharacterized protein n=1 Tax=Lipomyces chichibuensis TaxID=1546026 RepID=UPI0033434140